jgi:hypothetical protein
MALSPAIFDRYVLTLDIAGFLQALTEPSHGRPVFFRQSGVQETDHRQPLLRTRRERPRCRAAEQRDELAAFHYSITSSARASTVGGTSSPSALAVLRLITNSNLVGAWTGSSAGFAPFRMRSTYWAARRNWSTRSGP